MSYADRKSDRELYLDALSIAHKWLWIAQARADKIGRLADVDSLGSALGSVHRLTESFTASGGPQLRTHTDAAGVALERLRVGKAEREARKMGAQPPRPARDGGRPRARGQSGSAR